MTSNTKQINDVIVAEINRFPDLFDKFSVKARLHLQCLLRFSFSGGCERVDEL
jgi:hypothetical protein